MDSQKLTGFYSMKKSEWEETQGNGANVWARLEPAVQRSALKTLQNWFAIHRGSQRGEGPRRGAGSLLEALGEPWWLCLSLIQEA